MTEIIKRKHERKELNHSIIVFDLINSVELGELVNVSIEGLMLITNKEVPIQSIYQLSLQLPTAINGKSTLELEADCLWCRKIEDFHRYWAGLQIIDASDAAMEQLGVLISQYAK